MNKHKQAAHGVGIVCKSAPAVGHRLHSSFPECANLTDLWASCWKASMLTFAVKSSVVSAGVCKFKRYCLPTISFFNHFNQTAAEFSVWLHDLHRPFL